MDVPTADYRASSGAATDHGGAWVDDWSSLPAIGRWPSGLPKLGDGPVAFQNLDVIRQDHK
jgi:hypothetical protein